MTNALTEAEKVFALRMLPHFVSGKSVEESARAVLADDERLFEAFFDRRHSQYVPTADERGRSFVTREGRGDVMARELTRTVYAALLAA